MSLCCFVFIDIQSWTCFSGHYAFSSGTDGTTPAEFTYFAAVASNKLDIKSLVKLKNDCFCHFSKDV